jgi:outer membrane protein assembly factor BamE (lipoprotein component of BamABCDE complex)
MRKLIIMLIAALSILVTATACLEDPAAAEEAVSGKPQTTLATQMKRVEIGMSEKQVVDILGKPNDAQIMEAAGSHNECWYYGDIGEWQLCFDDMMGPYGLTSKNHY